MKKLFAFIIAAVTVCTSVQAQTYPAYRLAPTLTYTSVAAGISNYIGSSINLIDCSKQRNVGISVASVGASASSAFVAFSFTPCVDGTTNTMLTNLTATISTNLNGTSIVYWGTNLDSLGYKGFLITAYTNGAALNVTNTLTYANKIGAP